MTRTMHVLALLVLSLFTSASSEEDNLLEIRNKFYHEEVQKMVGHDIELTEYELKANQTLMKFKLKELDNGFLDTKSFDLSKHFFKYKDKVKDTQLYEFIKKMPKGALLHAHDMGMLSPDYLMKLTYMNNLYVCFYGDNNVTFYFSKTFPKVNTTCPCHSNWQLMRDVRYSSPNIKKFDAKLRRHFTMVIDNPQETYTDVNTVWAKFEKYFYTVGPLLQYKPNWEKYFYDTLRAARRDGIMYLEIRSILPPLYDMEGNEYNAVKTAETYKSVADKFMETHPDFLGVKLIYAPSRRVNPNKITEYIRIAKEIKAKMPDFFAGLDIVGQEDFGGTLHSFFPQLLKAKKEFDLFLHAGETIWNGASSDDNLYDAIVLGSKRIGHGFSLVKHPILMKEVKKRDIALEVNVISNMVLKLVDDVRNHPLAVYLAQGFPVVLGSDDPGLWEADILSHDFYVTFLGVANRYADLRLLKKLALNSLTYSTYPDKDKLFYEFDRRWNIFIYSFVREQAKLARM